MRMKRCLAMVVALVLSVAGSVAAPGRAGAAEITVFAAASLKTALDAFAAEWRAGTGDGIAISYGSSAALARQIQQGAPADLFLSAATDWMDVLSRDGLIRAETRHDLFGNSLVLIAHGRDAAPVSITPGLDLPGLLGEGKLAMGMVGSVPAGVYGKQALQSLGLWAAIEGSVAQAENVRAALALVATGEAPLGIVYGSDAVADDGADDAVSVIGTFPSDSHAPIVYPAAMLSSSTSTAALAFLKALSGEKARAIFVAQGFRVLP